jgi:hypothetical protein
LLGEWSKLIDALRTPTRGLMIGTLGALSTVSFSGTGAGGGETSEQTWESIDFLGSDTLVVVTELIALDEGGLGFSLLLLLVIIEAPGFLSVGLGLSERLALFAKLAFSAVILLGATLFITLWELSIESRGAWIEVPKRLLPKKEGGGRGRCGGVGCKS